jgi:hypothetical protein
MESTSDCPGSEMLCLTFNSEYDEYECPWCGEYFQLDIMDDSHYLPIHAFSSPDPSPPQTESMPAAE